MICKNCGNEMRDDARFCPHCGMVNDPGPGSALPQSAAPYSSAPAWESPEGGGKKKKTGLIIAVAAAVVAVAAVVVAMMSGLFSNPKKQVEAALVKSAAAYAQAEKALGLPDTGQWQRDRNIDQRMQLELTSINSDLIGYDLSALSGLSLGLNVGYSGRDRFMNFELFSHWGEDDLLTFRMTADDALVYFNSPQLTGETRYGVNTETFGADITEITGDDSMKDVSFNFFDMVDRALEEISPEVMEQRLDTANKALFDTMEVRKTGARTLDLNGTEARTTAYRAVIPQQALEDYVDEIADMLSSVNYFSVYEEMLRQTGMPQTEIDGLMDDLEGLDVYGELAGELKDLIGKIGDLELDICLSGGYVSALMYEDHVSGSDVALSLYLGGGEEYVDDLNLEIEVDGVRMTVTSTGDHGGKSGVFTDKTTFKGDPLKMSPAISSVTSELRYEPKKADGNFSWDISIPGTGALEMSGSLTARADSVALNLDDVCIKVMGLKICTLAFDYYTGCSPSKAPAQDVELITRMNEQELMQMVLDTQARAMQFSSDIEELFVSRLPAELFYGMLY